MSKNFKIARKPGQAADAAVSNASLSLPAEKGGRSSKVDRANIKSKAKLDLGATTRKTIEVPEGYFYQVKMRALQRRILEKELWAEIIKEYFEAHPA